MTFRELFKKWQRKIGDNIFFSLFKRRFIKEIETVPTTPIDWQDREMISGETLGFYSFTANVLFETAIGLANSTDDEIYQKATAIILSLREILEDKFSIELQEIEILSPSKIMRRAKLIEITEDEDGE